MKKISIIFLTLFLFTTLQAQNTYNFKQVFRETKDLVKQPSNWDTGEWLTFGGLVAGTYLTMQLDETIRAEMLKDRSYVDSPIMIFGTMYGEPLTSLAIGTLFIVHGAANDNRPNEKLGFEILQSMGYTVGFTSIAKISFGRARPSVAKTASEFYPVTFDDNDHWSFFSGHTSLAFSLSTVISANVKGDFWKAVSFVPAFVTGFSRVYHNRHWTSDVLMGAAVGYFVGRFLTNLHERHEEENRLLNQPPPSFVNFSLSF